MTRINKQRGGGLRLVAHSTREGTMTAQYRVKREQTVIIPGLENALAQGIDWANTIGFVTIEARVLDCIAKEQPGRWCDHDDDGCYTEWKPWGGRQSV